MRPNTLLSAALAIGCAMSIVHCSSEEEGTEKTTKPTVGGSAGVEAKKFFMGNVFPQLNANCANGCHNAGLKGAPPFLTTTAEGSYTAIEGVSGYIAAYNQSPLANKGMHSGPALTDNQSKLMNDWLTLEVNARRLSFDPAKPPNLREGFKRIGFGVCSATVLGAR